MLPPRYSFLYASPSYLTWPNMRGAKRGPAIRLRLTIFRQNTVTVNEFSDTVNFYDFPGNTVNDYFN